MNAKSLVVAPENRLHAAPGDLFGRDTATVGGTDGRRTGGHPRGNLCGIREAEFHGGTGSRIGDEGVRRPETRRSGHALATRARYAAKLDKCVHVGRDTEAIIVDVQTQVGCRRQHFAGKVDIGAGVGTTLVEVAGQNESSVCC